jgi:hypothetical protein
MDSAKPKQMVKLKERGKEMVKPKVRRSGTGKLSVRLSQGPSKGQALW